MSGTVGVLSPFVGGDYYGAIIRGIHRAARAGGGRVIAVQTLDPGTRTADHGGSFPVLHRTGFGHVDGLVILPGALGPGHVSTIQDAGLDVVLVGHRLPGLRAVVVSADNSSGVASAVTHLVEHGHRRIAFAGYLAVSDVRERRDGYLEGLRRHGIDPDPAWLLETEDNHETGGAAVVGRLLACGTTAVITGTDRNAMGLIEQLHRLRTDLLGDPVDTLVGNLAVIGFDDIPASRYLTPSLTSVHQPLDRLGEAAYAQLARLRRARTAAPDGPRDLAPVRVPTDLTLRASCGCPAPTLALTGEEARAQFEALVYLQNTLNTQYDVDVELLSTNRHDPRSLGWLSSTPASAAVLGLWADDPAVTSPGRELEIAGTFGETVAPRVAVGRRMQDAAFPPAELFDVADRVDGEIVFVVPVRNQERDWGLLAAVGRIQDDTPPGREMMNHSGALLTAALDREVLMKSLQEQEFQLRRLALHDPLTGLPNRAQLVDRLEQAARRATRDPRFGFCVMFVDLDGFKAVNDVHGHAVGDGLLVLVARKLTESVREVDTVARFGGDEFVILMEDASERVHQSVVARIRAVLEGPLLVEGIEVQVGLSIGIADSGTAPDPDRLLRDADAAMYRAKHSRRG